MSPSEAYREKKHNWCGKCKYFYFYRSAQTSSFSSHHCHQFCQTSAPLTAASQITYVGGDFLFFFPPLWRNVPRINQVSSPTAESCHQLKIRKHAPLWLWKVAFFVCVYRDLKMWHGDAAGDLNLNVTHFTFRALFHKHRLRLFEINSSSKQVKV